MQIRRGVTALGGGQGDQAPLGVQRAPVLPAGPVEQVGAGGVELGQDDGAGPDPGEHVRAGGDSGGALGRGQ